MTRRFSSISAQTTLATGISNTALSAVVATGTASTLLGGISLTAGDVDQFKIIFDPGTASAEIMYVTGVTSDTLTIQRGKDGTSAVAHTGGAEIKHVLTGEDLTYFNTGVVPTSNLAVGLPFPGSTSGTNTLKAPAVTGTVTNTLPAITGTLMSAESVDAAASKATPVDADEIPLADSAASYGIKKLTWANLKNAVGIGSNRILNGNMAIDQRNNGAAQTLIAGASAYTVDRWLGYCAGANVVGQRVAGSGGSQYRYQYTGAAAVTAIQHMQRIEQAASFDLSGQTVTLAVDLANSLLTTVTWTAYYANAADNFSAVTQIATGTFTVSAAVARFSTQIAIPAAATTGIQIVLSVGAQTSGTWTIGRAQLEIGSVATAFQTATGDPASELAACQRFYTRAVAGAIYGRLSAASGAASTVTVYISTPFPVRMRAIPTSIDSSALALYDNVTVVPCTVTLDAGTSQDFASVNCAAAGLTQFRPYFILGNSNAAAYIGFSAEL